MSESVSGLKALTAQIVAAYVGNNATDRQAIPILITRIHRALQGSQVPAGQIVNRPRAEPAVPVKKSISAEHLICLECGEKLSMIKRHLYAVHHLTAEQYPARWNLPSTYPLVTLNHSKKLSVLAKKSGLRRSR